MRPISIQFTAILIDPQQVTYRDQKLVEVWIECRSYYLTELYESLKSHKHHTAVPRTLYNSTSHGSYFSKILRTV
ncbi:hypothetical protein DPMN_093752 [Dreissena polymorpha]|uniref:Uncharacterized protein n=1 Tax=Dreissena polymorpha TaxID=45954 RepID=A0A9D4L3J0_DREPO|nr:hypothetical protein DPMN_093751 [Dreissena polymorpha]KAH3851272.1 hypothetical protein DPMN_093752 [Dreissena polymorpha]